MTVPFYIWPVMIGLLMVAGIAICAYKKIILPKWVFVVVIITNFIGASSALLTILFSQWNMAS